jgi:hypothetical protein
MAEPWADGDVLTAAHLAGLPWGLMGAVVNSADQTGISTITDITGLTVTWTATSSRTYLTLVKATLRKITNAGDGFIHITDGAGGQKDGSAATLAINDYSTLTAVAMETGLTGSITRKARASASTATVTVLGAANYTASILVFDLG